MIENNKAQFINIFIWIILVVVIAFVSIILVYMGNTVGDELKTHFQEHDAKNVSEINYTQTYEDTFAELPAQLTALYWISIFLIIGMIFGIFIGSYLVTIKPFFFAVYVFLMIPAIVVAAEISNAYETVIADPTLAATASNFTAVHYVLANFPIWVTIVGFIGGILMFINWARKR